MTPGHGASLLTRKRFQLAGSLTMGALVPWLARLFLHGDMFEPATINGLLGNIAAIAIAFWMRLSIETYPGIRRSAVIPAVGADRPWPGHPVVRPDPLSL